MKAAFTPVRLGDWVKLNLCTNPDTKRAEVIVWHDYAESNGQTL